MEKDIFNSPLLSFFYILVSTYFVSYFYHSASEGMVHVAIAMQILYKANQIRLEHDASKGLARLEDFYCHQLSR